MTSNPPLPRLSGHRARTYITAAIFQFVWGLVKYLPTPIGDPLRRAVLGAALAECRLPLFWIRSGIDVWWPGGIRIGRSCLNENVLLNGYGGITIGDHCLVGRGASFFSGGHTFDRCDRLILDQPLQRAPIAVGDDVYFGLNAVVLGGVTIGSGAIIGAGAVVVDDVPPGAIVAGVPARLVRYRDGYPERHDDRAAIQESSARAAASDRVV
jgi:acetyltransferase-like isoleucine patch superfamily enzyme